METMVIQKYRHCFTPRTGKLADLLTYRGFASGEAMEEQVWFQPEMAPASLSIGDPGLSLGIGHIRFTRVEH
jgi:hypothetical protein